MGSQFGFSKRLVVVVGFSFQYPTVPKRSQQECPPVRCDTKQLSKMQKSVKILQSGTLGYGREHTEFEGLLPRLTPRSNLKICMFVLYYNHNRTNTTSEQTTLRGYDLTFTKRAHGGGVFMFLG